ncbi:MAG: FtsW/RodA/SpoVE family cell cycle protein [Prevotellaceae bacterium]|jgi:cell division protein FtsW|nr:FtsW/RodA/SpoVE family cell cycle protein [Prevotellaceae bacterium]
MDLLRNIFKGDKGIWIIFLLLCLISIIEVFSASASLTYKSGDHWGPITQHIALLTAGAVVVVITHNISFRWFPIFPMILLPLSAVLLIIVSVSGFISGDRVGGAARFMRFMGLSFQPSELAKMAVIVATAFILSRTQGEKGAKPAAFKYIMWMSGVMCLLIFPENFSTAALLFAVVYMMMFIGGVAVKKLLLVAGALGGTAIVGVLFLTLTKDMDVPFMHRFDTWRARIERWWTDDTPTSAAQFKITDKNAQETHARIAVATSNVLGKGPGNSVQRDFLSLAFSDFIYAIIIEELGLLPAAIIVLLYLWLLMRVGRIAKKCEATFPAFLIIGIGLLLVTQALFNMMVAVGIVPVTGQPLPLVSKGGTSILINCAYIGMILSVSRYTAKLDKERAEREAQRLLDEAIPMEVSTGTAEAFNDAQTAEDPTSDFLNHDE